MKDATVACLGAAALLVFAAGGCKSNGGGESSQQQAESQPAKSAGTGSEEGSEQGAGAKPSDEKSEDESAKGGSDDEESGKSGDAKATIGEPAPDFTLTSVSGEEHTLSDYRGDIVVLEWTNLDCPYVEHHHEAGTMTSVYDEVGDGEPSVQWLAIDSSNFAESSPWGDWTEKHGIDYPVLLNPEGDVGKKYGAKTTPHMYVIGPKGKLRYKGAIDDDDSVDGEKENPTNYVEKAVKAIQNGKEVAKPSTKSYGCSVKYGS